MKSIFASLVFVSLFTSSIAQNIEFTLANPQPMLHEAYSGNIISGDLDNDGDMDIVQSGIGENFMGTSIRASVFLNDGDGNFTLEEQNFNDFWSTEGLVMGDLDNDDDLDIIITALNRTDFYRNDGQSQFIFDDSTPFLPSFFGDLIVGDVDGDGDNDVIQFGKTGSSSADPYFALLFLNDGSGAFTQSQNTTFLPFEFLNLEFIDLEGDGDLDILSFGANENFEAQVRIYENDGSGNFSIFSDSNIAPHKADAISVGDFDNDGDEDVLISGEIDNSIPKTTLYINDGGGHFTELIDTPFPDIFVSSNAFTDLDNDNDLDVLLIGSMAGGIPNIFSIVFENLGNNTFIATDSLGGEYIASNTIADFNGDGNKDIIIQGLVDNTNVYWNTTDISTGLEDVSLTNFSIFPNPSSGSLQIKRDDNSEFDLLEVFDLLGNRIHNESLPLHGTLNIEINVSPGIYSIQLSGDRSNVSRLISIVK